MLKRLIKYFSTVRVDTAASFIFTIAVIVIFFSINLKKDITHNENKALNENKLVKYFNNYIHEDPIYKTIFGQGGYATISNEDRLDLFKEHVGNLGGGYIGVGSTQNFILAAWAKSEWIWLTDFTPIVVAANKVHVALIKESDTPEKYKALWERKSKDIVNNIIQREYADNPDLKYILNAWEIAQRNFLWRFELLSFLTKKWNYDIWLTDQNQYNIIRNLAIKGHIKVLKGNLNKDKTVLGAARNAKMMGVIIRVIYFSNAEEYFPRYCRQFRKNFLEMPIDNRSIIVRTMSVEELIYPWAPGSNYSLNEMGFHYNVMPAFIFHRFLRYGKDWPRLLQIIEDSEVNMKTGFSITRSVDKKYFISEIK